MVTLWEAKSVPQIKFDKKNIGLHHLALKYLPNEQGYKDLSNELWERLKTIIRRE